MFDVALPDGSDLSALAKSGMYSVKAPVNGATVNDAFVLAFSGMAAGKTFEYQLFIDSATGVASTRARTGGDWSAWAALGSGGGGGGSSANDITADPALWNAVFGGEPSPFDTFADISAALGGAYGTVGSVQEMISALEYLIFMQILTPLTALVARNASSTVQRAITYRDGSNDPTGDYNSVNTAGASVASGTGGFFVGDTFQGAAGKLWINCGESNASPPVAVWKNLSQLT